MHRGPKNIASLCGLPAHALIVLAMAPASWAEERPARVVAVNIENDAVLDTDRYYTNGFRIEHSRDGISHDGLAGRVAQRVLRAETDDDILFSMALGHAIFTPDDIGTPAPLPDQRPYAGFLFADATVNVQDETGISWLHLQLGLLGPAAGGEDIQNWFHTNVLGNEEARGWDNQLDNEVGFVIAYDRQTAPRLLYGGGGRGIDLSARYGVAAGTLHTDARAGVMLRAGSGLDLDYGPPRIRPALGGSGFFHEGPGLTAHVFAGIEGRAVAHDVFLDGSLFKEDQPGVDRKTVVADVQAGLIVQYKSLQFSMTMIHRTKEFEAQDDAQQFTSFGIAKRF